MKKIFVLLVIFLTLPALLFIFSPNWQLGSLGLILGVIGNFVSPVLILYLLYYFAVGEWR